MWAEPAKPFAEVKPSQREFSRKRFGFSEIFRYLVPISILHSEPCLWSAAYEQGPRGREGRAFYPRGQEARCPFLPLGAVRRRHLTRLSTCGLSGLFSPLPISHSGWTHLVSNQTPSPPSFPGGEGIFIPERGALRLPRSRLRE